MRVVILTSWGGTFPIPILSKFFSSELEIVRIYSQGVHWKRILKYEPSYWLNYKDNVAEFIRRSGREDIFTNIASINRPEIVSFIQANSVDYIISVSYGEILIPEIIEAPTYGVINFHPGILPENQGADPVAAVISNRLSVSGTTVHFIDPGVDTGDIIDIETKEVDFRKPYRHLEFELGLLGANLVNRLVQNMLRDLNLPRTKQKKENSILYKKPRQKGAEFNFQMKTEEIESIINTYSAFPTKAYFKYRDFRIEVSRCASFVHFKNYSCGELLDQGMDYLVVSCLDSVLLLESLRVENLDVYTSHQLINTLFSSEVKFIQ